MSKDIRSFFQVKVQKKVPDVDSDEIPESPDVNPKGKKKQTRRKRVISDSDEDTNSSNKKHKSNLKNNDKSEHKITLSPKKREIKAVDIFSKSPIKRTEPIVKKTKIKTEIGIHSDDEFEKSLLDLDESGESRNKSSKKDIASNEEFPKTINIDKKEKIIKNEHKSSTKTIEGINDKEARKRKSEEIINNTTNIQSKKIVKDKDVKTVVDVKKEEVILKEKKDKNNKVEKLDKEEALKRKNTKIDFSEFLEDTNASVTSNLNKSLKSVNEQKKKKLDKSLNESVLSDEERHERKRYSAALYQKYLNRSGPKNLGSKEIPEGAPNCLKDCAFLLTGVLDSFERDEVVAAVTQYGGVIKSGISKKVTHVIAGDDAGPAKIAKAEEMGIKILSENDFLQMISSSLNSEANQDVKKHPKSKNKNDSRANKIEETSVRRNGFTENEKIGANIKKEREMSIKNTAKKVEKKVHEEPNPRQNVDTNSNKEGSNPKDINRSGPDPASLMWVDKYKPQNLKQIIGQHGDASNVKKLSNWLTKWYANRKAKLPKPSPWAKSDDGGYYKAALLSGPPGVGKTTTVSLVCKELGFDAVEFNASDTRSKTLIREQIGELLTTTSLSGYANGMTGKGAVSKKHVLVMDEVDGMAGNEDRGGLQELISLIKLTSVPVICMCNDRNSDKMRTLVNYCYDLRFSRPRVDQIKAAMMSICFKEGLKVPGDVMSQLITAAGQDVRQVLHLLSMWAADGDAGDAPHRLRDETKRIRKDIKMGPWEAIRRALSAEEHKTMTINDKSDLFFSDYSLMPLFVQENYLGVAPNCTSNMNKHEVLERISRAADSISLGDLVDARIRRNQAWSLLPIQAMYSSVIPGHHMAGRLGQIQFPGWLGRNSRASKMQRLAQQIHAHTRLSTSGSKSSIFLDYAPHLRDAIVTPLIKDKTDGIQDCLDLLESYHLLREDLESLTEISLWPGQTNPTVLIDAKVKAAMTRTYNKKAAALPYAPTAIKRGRGQADEAEDDQYDEENNEDSDPENDALIKKKKKESDKVDKAGPSKLKTNTTKEKKKKK